MKPNRKEILENKLRTIVQKIIKEESGKNTISKNVVQKMAVKIEKKHDTRTVSALIKYLQSVPFSDLVKYMENHLSGNTLFPSYWCQVMKVPYPGFLAKAINMTSAKEPLSDLYNIYYSRRILSPEARAEFKRELFSNPKQPYGPHEVPSIFSTKDPEEIDDVKESIKTFGMLKVPECAEFLKKFYPHLLKK